MKGRKQYGISFCWVLTKYIKKLLTRVITQQPISSINRNLKVKRTRIPSVPLSNNDNDYGKQRKISFPPNKKTNWKKGTSRYMKKK
jgi:hypothetical protein